METVNEYLRLATEQGIACGRFVGTLKGIDNAKARNYLTIKRAAIAFMRHLPLNDIALERKIQDQFELAARMAANIQ